MPAGIGLIGAMRLLFFNSQFPQPSQTFVVDQIRHAGRLGLDVTVYAKRYSPQLAAEHAPDLARLVLHDRPRDAATLRRIAAGLARRPALLARYAERRAGLGLHASDLACAAQLRHAPDVIVANFGQNGVVAARIKQAFFPAARLAVIFHGWDLSAYVAANGWEAYRRAAPAIDVAIAVNRPWAERLRANTAMRDVVVHHLGVDLGKIAPLPPTAREATGFRIVFVGRMVEKKGLAYLIAAVAELHQRGRPATVDVVGDGPEEAPLRAAAERAGVAEAIVFHGRQPAPVVSSCRASPPPTATRKASR
jgi:colanic acid/amylovoran biosynthesis glycosyltransferase